MSKGGGKSANRVCLLESTARLISLFYVILLCGEFIQ